jgi:hypothetical protein
LECALGHAKTALLTGTKFELEQTQSISVGAAGWQPVSTVLWWNPHFSARHKPLQCGQNSTSVRMKVIRFDGVSCLPESLSTRAMWRCTMRAARPKKISRGNFHQINHSQNFETNS